MSEQDLVMEAADLERQLLFEAAEGYPPGYHQYFDAFPDLQWKLTKDPNFHWLDLFGRGGGSAALFLEGMQTCLAILRWSSKT
jgi:hypothetical protein